MGLAVWRIHRRMGMSGGLMANALSREVNRRLNPEETARLLNLHDKHFVPHISQVRALSGAKELLTYLSRRHIPWAIATSGRMVGARPMLKLLGLGSEAVVITREQVKHARPDPDLLLAGAERLQVPISESVVVGDSVWDLLTARRVRALAIGLLSGGYGQGELESAGAYRVYEDPADLLQHIDEVGVRSDL